MGKHDLERVSIDALISLQEVAASGRADIAALIANFRAQRRRANNYRDGDDEVGFQSWLHTTELRPPK
jgi:hypothetical protein